MENKSKWIKPGSIGLVGLTFIILLFTCFSKCSDADNNATAYWKLKKKDSLNMANMIIAKDKIIAHLDSGAKEYKSEYDDKVTELADSTASFAKKDTASIVIIPELKNHIIALQKDSAEKKVSIVAKSPTKAGRKFHKHKYYGNVSPHYDNSCGCN
jgi:hypothetical protein